MGNDNNSGMLGVQQGAEYGVPGSAQYEALKKLGKLPPDYQKRMEMQAAAQQMSQQAARGQATAEDPEFQMRLAAAQRLKDARENVDPNDQMKDSYQSAIQKALAQKQEQAPAMEPETYGAMDDSEDPQMAAKKAALLKLKAMAGQ